MEIFDLRGRRVPHLIILGILFVPAYVLPSITGVWLLSKFVVSGPLGLPDRFVACSTTVVIGVVLYMFRRRQQMLYGLCEVGFATAVAWHTLGAPSRDATTNLLALIGVVYLVVRGFTNLADGLEKQFPKAEPEREASTSGVP